MYSDQHYTHKL